MADAEGGATRANGKGAPAARRRGERSGSARPPRPAPGTRRPRPWLWTGVVVVCVVAAVTASFLFDDAPPTEVDLSGVDLTAFCATYRDEVAPLAAGDAEIDVAGAGAFFRQRADAYARLAAVSPEPLVEDVETLAAAAGRLADAADALAAAPAGDDPAAAL
ncbi:MAG: hypothetical protein MUF83_14350, partial [Acidimicrobiales bacterium]|nr:hypothetical protein [Acidimicrobiales bacterium]